MRYVSLFCKTFVLFICLYQTLLKYCNIRTVSIGFLATCRTVELLKHCNIYKINLKLELGRKMVFVSVVKRHCLAKWVQSSIFFFFIDKNTIFLDFLTHQKIELFGGQNLNIARPTSFFMVIQYL